MIKIKFLEKSKENNYNAIDSASLWKEKGNYYIAFHFEKEEQWITFENRLTRLFSIYSDDFEKMDFLLIEQSNLKNITVIKGNIHSLIFAFDKEGILKGSNLSVFNDPEEEDIIKFLKASRKTDTSSDVYRYQFFEEENINFKEDEKNEKMLPNLSCNIL